MLNSTKKLKAFIASFHLWMHVTSRWLRLLPQYMWFSCHHYYFYFSSEFQHAAHGHQTATDLSSHEDTQASLTKHVDASEKKKKTRAKRKLIFNLYLLRANTAWKHIKSWFFFIDLLYFDINDHCTDPLATVFKMSCTCTHTYLLAAFLQEQGKFMQFI